MHWWGHIEAAIYILAAVLVFYRPPRALAGTGQFIERHLGDSVGFYILHLGILLVVISGIYPEVMNIGQTGQSLILAGMVALKLTKTAPPENGTRQDTTISPAPPPAPQPIPPAAPADSPSPWAAKP